MGQIRVVLEGSPADLASILGGLARMQCPAGPILLEPETTPMPATAAVGVQDRTASTPRRGDRNDSGVPRGVERLLADWRGYLSHQQAFGEEHVDKSIESARLWCDWAGKHGWNSPSAMRWAQALIKKHARKTAQNKVSQARKFCEYCLLVSRSAVNPMEHVTIANGKRDRSRHWAPFSADDVRRLIEAAEARESCQDGRHKHRGPLCSTVYAFLALTGFRAKEARLQAWSDVDLVRATIIVTSDKAGRQDEIPLCTEAVSVLKAWRKWSPGERVFPSFPSKNTLRADMRAAKVPGLSDGKKGEWHRFRKCAVRERAAAGADLRTLHHYARHDDIGTTVKLYDQAHVEEMRAVAELMPRLNGFLKREKAENRSVANPGGAKSYGDSREGNRTVGLDLSGPDGRNTGVQVSTARASPAPSQSEESGDRRGLAKPEQLDPQGSLSPLSQGCGTRDLNGAVGNWPPGSIDPGTADRVLRILEALLGIQAAAEGPGHVGRLGTDGSHS